MRQFFAVFKFELGNYFKNKAFLITSIVIPLLIMIGLSIPSLMNSTGIGKDNSKSNESTKQSIGLYDPQVLISDKAILDKVFSDYKLETINDESEIKNLINNDKIDCAFVVNSLTDFKYYVKNTSMSDAKENMFKSVLSELYHKRAINDLGVNYNDVSKIYNKQITDNVQILGKDSVRNFAYVYVLIMIIYMMIVIYGQVTATSVTAEKSNRSIEILVTSTSSNSLIFGKVIASALASIIQTSITIASAFIAYNINKDAWEHKLDFAFNIPTEVLIVFGVFGVLGFLLYCFIYAVLGALVSKAEDVNKSSLPITLVLVAVFMLCMTNLSNPDGIMPKILSYVPFSSCFAMFLRVSMGSVALYEIIISLGILIVTIGVVGYIGAKIYRMGTLRIGNQIKLFTAIKHITNKEE